MYITNTINVSYYLTVYRLSAMKLRQYKSSMLLSSAVKKRQQNQHVFCFVGMCIKFPMSGTFLLAKIVISDCLLLYQVSDKCLSYSGVKPLSQVSLVYFIPLQLCSISVWHYLKQAPQKWILISLTLQQLQYWEDKRDFWSSNYPENLSLEFTSDTKVFVSQQKNNGWAKRALSFFPFKI